MGMEQYTFIGFLITSVIALAGFSRWLVKKIIALTEECHESMKDLKNAVANNTEAVKELKLTISAIKK